MEEVPAFFGWELLVGTALTFGGGSLCAGTGIGGGAFYIPVFTLVLGLSPHISIPLSKVTIFGIAIGGFLVNWRKRHPLADRPLIAYDVAMVMEPMTLAGTIIGVYLNVMFPAYLIIVFLILLLSFSAYKTVKKGLATYKKERAAEEAEKEGEDPMGLIAGEEMREEGEFSLAGDDEMYSLDGDTEELRELGLMDEGSSAFDEELQMVVDEDLAADFGEEGTEAMDLPEPTRSEETEKLLKADSRIPLAKIGLLCLLWAGMFVLILLKGGTKPDSSLVPGLQCGSVLYWLLVLLEFPYLTAFALAYAYYLRQMHLRKVACAYPFVDGDIRWDLRNSILLPLFSTMAGIAAGFLGIGGGMVKGPLMLHMDMLPQVTVVTSAFMIIFTSSSTTAQFILLGKLPLTYAIWYFTVGLLAAVVGNLGVSYMVKKYRKQSYINLLLAVCIVLSAFLMTFMLVYGMVQGTESTSFSAVCEDA